MQRGLAPIVIIVGIVLLLIGGLVGYILSTKPQGPVYMSPLPAPTTNPSPISTQNSVDETVDWITYTGENFAVKYPGTWFKWNFGRGGALEYFQINSVPNSEVGLPDNRVHIVFEIQKADAVESPERDKKIVEDLQKSNPNIGYVISEQILNGQRTIIKEETVDNLPSYSKSYWLIAKGNKYMIYMTIHAESTQMRDQMKEQYGNEFEKIVSTLKLP